MPWRRYRPTLTTSTGMPLVASCPPSRLVSGWKARVSSREKSGKPSGLKNGAKKSSVVRGISAMDAGCRREKCETGEMCGEGSFGKGFEGLGAFQATSARRFPEQCF